MFVTLLTFFDILGLIAFATTGALVASRQQMDITGFVLLAVAAGVGGGTLRDVVLGLTPVFWVREPAPVLLCAGVGALGFFLGHLPLSRMRLVLWCDAIGLAVFSVLGAEVALEAGAHPAVAAALGVATASFGGILRDILGGESPLILRREIYVTAALVGALTFIGALRLGLERDMAVILGGGTCFALRGIALIRGWSLPRYKPRPPQSL
jgi:uncharacterized membrane protein YeiH